MELYATNNFLEATMFLIFCRKCSDIFKLEKMCRWCSCGSCGGAAVQESYVHWGSSHHVLRLSEENMKDLIFTPERWKGFEVALIAVPTVRACTMPSPDPMKYISKDK